jgi:phosphatidylserine/phosphatidylglycerophosphate/cardiolipin synthase-like enzyme
MNKQFVAAVTSIAMMASSCVSTPKNSRYVASVANNEAIEKIAIQGTPIQTMKEAVGGKYDFRNKPWNPSLFTNEDIKKIASGYNLKFSKAQILTDNDAAFQQKLSVIKNAKKELRLVYFIYSDDATSSVLNSALLAKAKEPQMENIYLLVDLITNYKNLDLFITLNEESKGKIKPFFYNFPSGQMIEDANYMTLPCPKGKQADTTCRQYKESVMATYSSKSAPTSFTKLFLTGIYGRSAAAMKAALGLGAQISSADYKRSDEDKQAMLDLAKITLGALKGNLIDKLKLSIAMAMYGEKINSILNELNGRFPIGLEKGNSSSAPMWDHFTDYNHHKLVLGDNLEMVNGGRNIEDSYHAKTQIEREDGGKEKYIFMDTDFYGKADLNKDPQGLADVARAFDSITQSTMVKDLKTVRDTLSYEFVANTGEKNEIGSAQRAIGYCMQEAQKGNADAAADLGGCILTNVTNAQLGYVTPQARRAAVLKNMKVGYDAYLKHDQNIKTEFQPLSANDLKTASFHYLENLSTDRSNNQIRIQGSKLGSEAENSKNIQVAWFRGLENTCKVSRDAKDASGNNVYSDVKPMQVIFHTAYFLMPSGMIHRIAQMLNNDFGDCSRVKITFITNSQFTTDLYPINILARYQLGALFNHYKGLVEYKKMFESPVEAVTDSEGALRYVPSTSSKAIAFKYKQFWPHIEYYEYSPAAVEDLADLKSKPDSLHTKTSLIGNDLIVGSANADIRSYYMDTNNAIMIRNAHEMNQSYISMIENLKTSGRIVNKFSNLTGKSFETLRAENNALLLAGAQKFNQEKRLTPEISKSILDHLDEAGKMIYDTTNDLLVYRGVLDQSRDGDGRGNTLSEVQRLNNKANAMDNLFKIF